MLVGTDRLAGVVNEKDVTGVQSLGNVVSFAGSKKRG